MSFRDHPLRPGDRAPDFELPAVNRDGTVSLADYRGKSAVFVALFRGLHCPFCRRQLARLSTTQEKLAREGVATVAVVNTQAERARQYFKYRPTSVVLAADSELRTHLAFGLPQFEILPDSTDPGQLRWPQNTTMQQLGQVPSLAAAGEVPEARSFLEAAGALNTRDGFEMMPADEESYARHAGVLEGQFLIDASGTIRWSSIEAQDSPSQMGLSPSDEEILAAARNALR